jgi:hypothetical protein
MQVLMMQMQQLGRKMEVVDHSFQTVHHLQTKTPFDFSYPLGINLKLYRMPTLL